MHIAVIGVGYVGLTASTALARLGHRVIGIDADVDKIQRLQQGISPIYEPGLGQMLREGLATGDLQFCTSLPDGLAHCDVIIIAVGTPPLDDGSTNLAFLFAVVNEITSLPTPAGAILIKSTVPVGTADRVAERLEAHKSLHVISNPEFLREGSALSDFFHPDRIIVGAESEDAAEIARNVYHGISARVLVVGRRCAELIKYASNAFLATKISFINELADLCEQVKVDVDRVSEGIGLDRRIGPAFLSAGLGYGGSCFPKDLSALRWMFREFGFEAQLLAAVEDVNSRRPDLLVAKVGEVLGGIQGRRIAAWGVSFKPNTDDTRLSPAVATIRKLLREGAEVHVYDPAASHTVLEAEGTVSFSNNPYDAATEADATVLLTDWNEFRQVDFQRLRKLVKQPVLIDGRNCLDANRAALAGFLYVGLGRATRHPVGASARP